MGQEPISCIHGVRQLDILVQLLDMTPACHRDLPPIQPLMLPLTGYTHQVSAMMPTGATNQTGTGEGCISHSSSCFCSCKEVTVLREGWTLVRMLFTSLSLLQTDNLQLSPSVMSERSVSSQYRCLPKFGL